MWLWKQLTAWRHCPQRIPKAVCWFRLPRKARRFIRLTCKYRSTAPVAIEIWNVDEQLRKITDITLYNDGLPPSPEVGMISKHSLLPGLRRNRCALFISVAPSEQGKTLDAPRRLAKIEIRRSCELNASPLEANHITGWKWGRPAKKQFLFLRMTKFTTPFAAIDWPARSISQRPGVQGRRHGKSGLRGPDDAVLDCQPGDVSGRSWHRAFGIRLPEKCICATVFLR